MKEYDINELNILSKRYSKKIKFNNIYYNDYILFSEDKRNKVIISSASLSIYLNYIGFKELIASELEYNNDKPIGIKFHNYGENKLMKLKELGIDHINILYTDSKSDKSLASISNRVIIVGKDKKRICNSYEEYLEAI